MQRNLVCLASRSGNHRQLRCLHVNVMEMLPNEEELQKMDGARLYDYPRLLQ